ncbi:hypothetical protein SAMN05216553_101253 [Lentzea fradiae]|uniref:Uncharacterized protein n=1 Tax=Lentzea fradiae TaxID=200378 RepID=A0A1G7KFA5_9PSEU|nr:hypothetical protein SAMN05216553_101253 [Lentzea fradiae]
MRSAKTAATRSWRLGNRWDRVPLPTPASRATAAIETPSEEFSGVVVNAVLFALAVFAAWGRFGPHSF